MRKLLFALMVLAAPAWAADPAEQRPGFGVVESLIPLKPQESAAAGGSAPSASTAAKKSSGGYLLRVRMDDGSVQIRQVKRRFSAGQRVLLTNAGDVLPD
jgi:hypothetical protein